MQTTDGGAPEVVREDQSIRVPWLVVRHTRVYT